jgi:hypothetical protein
MSARKIDSISHLEQPVTVEAPQTRLELSADKVVVHKGGIEFRSPSPFRPWSEMTVVLQSPGEDGKLNCSGVVVACTGNKHTGFNVSLLFTGLSRQAQERLDTMAHSELGVG